MTDKSNLIHMKAVLPEFTAIQIKDATDLHYVALQIQETYHLNLNILRVESHEEYDYAYEGVEVDEENKILKSLGDPTADPYTINSFDLATIGDWFVWENHSKRNVIIPAERDENNNVLTDFNVELIPTEMLKTVVVKI